MKLIDKDALVAEIEGRIKKYAALDVGKSEELEAIYGAKCKTLIDILKFLDTLEVKEVIAEQECTCNEALNRIIGGSWNLLCPVNKLGLKTGDKVKVIIKAKKGE